MFKLKKTALATGLIAFAFSGALHASVSAMSMTEMTDFVIKNGSGDILDYPSDFASLEFTSTSDMDVALGAASDTYNNPGSTSSIYVAPLCVGTCPAIGDDTYPVLSGAPSSNYATADLVEEGAPITGLTGYTNPARIANGSYVGIDSGTLAGSANSNNNLNAKWEFSLNEAQTLSFEFDIRHYLEAFVSGGEAFPGFATAASSFSFSIAQVISAPGQPDILNPLWTYTIFTNSISVNAPVGVDTYAFVGAGLGTAFDIDGVAVVPNIAGVAINFLPDVEYQLSARITTLVDARRVAVPEPGLIGLLGLGLLGVGIAKRKQMKAA